jgi:hypothetical protein
MDGTVVITTSLMWLKTITRIRISLSMSPKKRAIAQLAELNKVKNGLNSFGFIFKDEKHGHVLQPGHVCYAYLMYFRSYREIKYFISVFPDKIEGITKKEIDNYLNWLVNKSPYRKAFAKCNWDIYTKGMVCDAKQPANYIVGALSAARATHEDPHLVLAWNGLVKHGVDPDLAHFASYHLSYNKRDDNFTYRIQYGTGHTDLDVGIMSRSEVKNFLNMKLVNPTQKFVESTKYSDLGIRTINKLWGHTGRGPFITADRFKIKENERKDAFGRIVPNYNIEGKVVAKVLNQIHEEILKA